MDLYLAGKAAEKKTEGFTTQQKPATSATSVFGLGVAVVAAYLSWNCNTKSGMKTLPKAAWAVLSACFGCVYLIYYALFRRTICWPPTM